jgi:rhombotail lipoprotein
MQRRLVSRRLASLLLGLACLTLLPACVSYPRQRRAGVLEYLYPQGQTATPARNVQLELPLRVGVAFVPEAGGLGLDSVTKQRLLERVRNAFEGTPEVESLQIVPSSYLTPGGGFDNLDQLRQMLGIDLIALVSYDQNQYDEMNTASLTYWTIIGAYVVPGNENETHTLVDASVFDIRARALLFNAAGRNRLEGRSTGIGAEAALREDSDESFRLAVDDMIGQLETSLVMFREQVKTGTVRGAGTPAVAVSGATGGGTGAGAVGWLELAGALVLVLAVAPRARRA